MKKLSAFLIGSIMGMGVLIAQNHTQKEGSDGYNHLSTKRIHESDIMYKKTVIRALDLRELQNLPLFAQNKWITKLIIDAVQAGTLTPYANDSLDLVRN